MKNISFAEENRKIIHDGTARLCGLKRVVAACVADGQARHGGPRGSRREGDGELADQAFGLAVLNDVPAHLVRRRRPPPVPLETQEHGQPAEEVGQLNLNPPPFVALS